jgi:S1-C subfamily serine protease
MKRVLVFIAALVMGAAASFGAVSKDRLPEFNAYADQTNFVFNHCSGTLIDLDAGYIITAHHCITKNLKWTIRRDGMTRDPERVAVHTPVFVHNPNLKKMFYAEVVKFDDTKDLALLQITKDIVGRKRPLSSFGFTKARKVLPATEKVYPFQEVFAVGNPKGYDYTISNGIVSRIGVTIPTGAAAKEADLIQFDARVNGGNSGGAVIDEDNNLIGVITWGWFYGDWFAEVDMGYNFAVSHKSINEFLSK